MPRRYRGGKYVAWPAYPGFFDRTPDMLEPPARRSRSGAQASGRDGGRTISLHRFRRDGIELPGRLRGGRAGLADDLPRDIEAGDGFTHMFHETPGVAIARNGIDARLPTDGEPDGEPRESAPPLPHDPSIDTGSENVATSMRAAGFSFEFSRIGFPVRGETGHPVTDGGATAVPVPCFVGRDRMATRRSGRFPGVGNAERHVAARIAGCLVSGHCPASGPHTSRCRRLPGARGRGPAPRFQAAGTSTFNCRCRSGRPHPVGTGWRGCRGS